MQSETKFSLRIFFQQSEFFFWTEFCLRLYLSQTEFCLRLNLSQTEFCLRLNFVSDYIPQLYFECNHLIYEFGFYLCHLRFMITNLNKCITSTTHHFTVLRPAIISKSIVNQNYEI